jgi:hypothetical protein
MKIKLLKNKKMINLMKIYQKNKISKSTQSKPTKKQN